MRVLVVSSGNSGDITSFVKEQADSLSLLEVEIEHYGIVGTGIIGYLRNFRPLLKHIRRFQPDLIHAHYGLSGLLANFQRKIPVVTTYHGSDIHFTNLFIISKIVMMLSSFNIFVSKKLAKKAGLKGHYDIISCGVNLDIFHPIPKESARLKFGLDQNKKYILFSSSFSNKNKNFPLAQQAIHLLKQKGYELELLEFRGYNREEASNLINAVDCIIVTSFKESGPLIVKEGMACNCPIVSTDVGDVKEIIKDTEGCFISPLNSEKVAEKILQAINYEKRTNGRDKILEYSLDVVSHKIYSVYLQCIK